VLFAETPDQAAAAAEKILKLEINGHMPRGVLVESRQPVAQEYYLGVTWDGIAKKPVMILSDMGGIDVEEVAEKHPEHIAKRHFSTLLPFSDYKAKELVADLATGSDVNAIVRFAAPLARIFMQYGLTLAEINPLAKLADGSFVALDAHVDMEAEVRGQHKSLLKELGIGDDETRMARLPTKFELEGAAINAADHRGVAGNVTEFDGSLGLIIGAGGGSLTLFDAVRNQGGDPANYCEIGGNPSVGKVANLTKLILSKPGVKKVAVMMNVVSNTRVDMVARGVIKGVIESDGDPADKVAIFRIPGSWEQEGFKLLAKYGIEYCDRTVSMYEAAGRAVAKAKGA
jgi:succinyl-CoA synthetase beta subunit